MVSRPVASYPLSDISAGSLYIRSHPKAVLGLGWNPPFRTYTVAVRLFFASNVFLIIVPFIPPAPGYEVFKRIPYCVSELYNLQSKFGFVKNLTADHLALYNCHASCAGNWGF